MFDSCAISLSRCESARSTALFRLSFGGFDAEPVSASRYSVGGVLGVSDSVRVRLFGPSFFFLEGVFSSGFRDDLE